MATVTCGSDGQSRDATVYPSYDSWATPGHEVSITFDVEGFAKGFPIMIGMSQDEALQLSKRLAAIVEQLRSGGS